jgi:hypothetical protein
MIRSNRESPDRSRLASRAVPLALAAALSGGCSSPPPPPPVATTGESR